MAKLSRKTLTLLTLGTAVTYFEASGQQARAAQFRKYANWVRGGIVIDSHMEEVAEMMLSQEGITDEQWEEQSARIDANVATALEELGETAAEDSG